VAETIEDRGSGPRWHWDNVMFDLRNAGLQDVIIDPLTVNQSGCGGEWNDVRFYLTWWHDEMTVLSMQPHSQAVVDALSWVLEYKPFVRYRRDGVVTIEWNKGDLDRAFSSLPHDKIEDVERLVA